MDTLVYDALNSRELVLDDIMRGRTELLILMAKDFLEGKTMGRIQRQAIEDNALLVEQDCMASITAVGKEPVDDLICINIHMPYPTQRFGLPISSFQPSSLDNRKSEY